MDSYVCGTNTSSVSMLNNNVVFSFRVMNMLLHDSGTPSLREKYI